MILVAMLGSAIRAGWPRTSGDDPAYAGKSDKDYELAPHERG